MWVNIISINPGFASILSQHIILELHVIEMAVEAGLGHQVIVGPYLGDLASIQDILRVSRVPDYIFVKMFL